MNGQSENLGEASLTPIFERRCDVVNFGDRQAAVHGAMAETRIFVVHAADMHVVAIHQP